MSKTRDAEQKIELNRVKTMEMLENQNFHTLNLTEIPNKTKIYV